MLIVLMLICILMLIFGIIINIKHDCDSGGAIALCVISSIGIICIIFYSLFIIDAVVDSRFIPDKIKMYQEENKKIEQQIDIVVKNYMEYEGNTFIECGSDGNGMTLINLYPELKSDALVKQQIDTYISNNNQIKTLKNDYINANSGRWWLYFGKKDISDLNFD